MFDVYRILSEPNLQERTSITRECTEGTSRDTIKKEVILLLINAVTDTVSRHIGRAHNEYIYGQRGFHHQLMQRNDLSQHLMIQNNIRHVVENLKTRKQVNMWAKYVVHIHIKSAANPEESVHFVVSGNPWSSSLRDNADVRPGLSVRIDKTVKKYVHEWGRQDQTVQLKTERLYSAFRYRLDPLISPAAFLAKTTGSHSSYGNTNPKLDIARLESYRILMTEVFPPFFAESYSWEEPQGLIYSELVPEVCDAILTDPALRIKINNVDVVYYMINGIKNAWAAI